MRCYTLIVYMNNISSELTTYCISNVRGQVCRSDPTLRGSHVDFLPHFPFKLTVSFVAYGELALQKG